MSAILLFLLFAVGVEDLSRWALTSSQEARQGFLLRHYRVLCGG